MTGSFCGEEREAGMELFSDLWYNDLKLALREGDCPMPKAPQSIANDFDRRSVVRRILTVFVVLLVEWLLFLFLLGGRYTEHFEVSDPTVQYTVHCMPEHVVEIREQTIKDGVLAIRVNGLTKGNAVLTAVGEDGSEYRANLYVNAQHKVRNPDTLNFTGQTGCIVGTLLFGLYICWLMLDVFRREHAAGRYTHDLIFCTGFGIFSVSTVLTQLYFFVNSLTRPELFTFRYMLNQLAEAGRNYMFLSSPVLILIVAELVISNLALIRHEGFRFVNILGILLGLLLLAGEGFAILLQRYDPPEILQNLRMYTAFCNIYAAMFVYLESQLMGSAICASCAAIHQPAYDKDYIIVLGCKIRKDGTLYPLLKGRADRALKFREEQLAKTGYAPILVPSGGQGSDEVMAEGEAVKNYFLSCGVPEEGILAETESTNTKENMQFSRKLIEERHSGAAVIFSTNNYHLLRSGIIAREAGLPAEGIGSKTKWYFWPNAFIREFVGLLASKWRQHTAMLVRFAILFGSLTLLIEDVL